SNAGMSAFVSCTISPSQIEKCEQKQPKPIHEMPVNGSEVRRGRSRDSRTAPRSKRNAQQHDNSAEQVQSVKRCQQVEKAAARIGDEKNTFCRKLMPGDQLASHKCESEDDGEAPPAIKAGGCAPVKLVTRFLNRYAAGQQNKGVQEKDPGPTERQPIISESIAHQKRAGKRHEKHNDSSQRKLDRREIGTAWDPRQTIS